MINHLNSKVLEIGDGYSTMKGAGGEYNLGRDRVGVREALRWLRPLDLAVKIDVDGSLNFATMCPGVGCVIRYHN